MAANAFYLANANVFIGSGNTVGQLKEFKIEDLQAAMEKLERIGMLSSKEVPVGFEQLKAAFTFSGPSPDFFSEVTFPFETKSVTILGVMTRTSMDPAQNKQFKAELIVRAEKVGMGTFPGMKLTEFERAVMVDYCKVSMDGIEMLEVDNENNVYKIKGVDKWASFRTTMGQ